LLRSIRGALGEEAAMAATIRLDLVLWSLINRCVPLACVNYNA
jgi:hypothetical protein